jgi:glutamine synthetase
VSPGDPGRGTLAETLSRLEADAFHHAHVGLFDFYGTFRERRLALADIPPDGEAPLTFVNVLPQWDAGENVFGMGPFVGEPVLIDPASARPHPFEEKAAVLIADYRGPSADLMPRPLLKRMIERAAAKGYEVQAGFEFEFYVLEEDARSLREKGFEPLAPYARENRCWAGESAAIYADFVTELEQTLRTGDIALFGLGCELGPGCFEATLRARDPLGAADDAALFKTFTKAYCRRKGLTASFMAQLGAGFAGLSGHLHLSLRGRDGGAGLFHDSADRHGMSDLFRHFVAGILETVPEAMALSHHTVNAYRRLTPGNWAPKSATWAPENYSAAVRVVAAPEARCRLEYRLPGADTNPYLTLAFALAAGLRGIEEGLTLPEPFLGGSPAEMPTSGASLPTSLGASAERLRSSATARGLFGERFVEHFATLCLNEENSLRAEVGAAERARYIEVV